MCVCGLLRFHANCLSVRRHKGLVSVPTTGGRDGAQFAVSFVHLPGSTCCREHRLLSSFSSCRYFLKEKSVSTKTSSFTHPSSQTSHGLPQDPVPHDPWTPPPNPKGLSGTSLSGSHQTTTQVSCTVPHHTCAPHTVLGTPWPHLMEKHAHQSPRTNTRGRPQPSFQALPTQAAHKTLFSFSFG